jgi:hypothetical protein
MFLLLFFVLEGVDAIEMQWSENLIRIISAAQSNLGLEKNRAPPAFPLLILGFWVYR